MAVSPKGRILCTEDDPDTRELIRFVLNDEGYEIVCAESGEDALRLAHAESFDLLLMDSWLPGLSGDELTKRIREFDSATPILFYSGAAQNSDKESARAAGAQGYIVKPSGMDEVVAEVARLISEARIAVPVKVIPATTSR
ncbi:MAG: response regulator transcription factor [Acidobacteriota bacterium]